MSWIESGEGKRLYDWARKNQGVFSFPEAAALAESYYCPFDNIANVCAYGFASIPELEEQLDELWKDEPVFDGIKKVCAVAAFKREPSSAQGKETEQDGEAPLKIPDFVYIF